MAAPQAMPYPVEEGVSLSELVDLALCTPEVGAVNFNILRILLHELLRKLNFDDVLADVDDIQAAQIEGFKSYIQGAGTMSPLPGVLKFSPSMNPAHVGHKGTTYHAHRGGLQANIPSGVVTPRSVIAPENFAIDSSMQSIPQPQQADPQPSDYQQPGQPQGYQQQSEQQQGYPQKSGMLKGPSQQPSARTLKPQQSQQRQQQQTPRQVAGVQSGQLMQSPSQGPQQQDQGQQMMAPQPAQGYPQPVGQQMMEQAQYPGQPMQQQQGSQPPMDQQQYIQQPGPPPQQFVPTDQQPMQQQQYPPAPLQQQAGVQVGGAQQYQQPPPQQQYFKPGPQQKQQQQTPRQPQQQVGGTQYGLPAQQQPQQPVQQQNQQQQYQQQNPQQQFPPAQPAQQRLTVPQAQFNQQQFPQAQPVQQGQQRPQVQQAGVQVAQPPPPVGQTGTQKQGGMPVQQYPPGQFAPPNLTKEQMDQFAVGQIPAGEGGLSPAGGFAQSPIRRKGQRPDGTPTSQQSGGSDRQATSPGGRSDTSTSTPRRDANRLARMEEKLRRLESQLESLYNLPDNPALIGMINNEDAKGMSINDMWQVIQLNNRVAATEAAIQKMASLIEDLAKQLKKMKKDASGISEHEKIIGAAKYELDKLKRDLDRSKRHLRDDIDILARAAGIDPSRLKYVPSFMRPSQQMATIYDAEGNALTGADGQPLTYAQVLLDENGIPLLDPEGNVIAKADFTAPHQILDMHGNPVFGPDGEPLLTQPMKSLLDSEGNELTGSDGRRLSNKLGMLLRNRDGSRPDGPHGQPFVVAEGHLLLDDDGAPIAAPDGRLVYTETGRISLDSNNQILKKPNGVPVYSLTGEPLLGPDGKQLIAADALPLYVIKPEKPPSIMKGPQGQTVMLHGRPLVSDQVLLAPNGEPYVGPDGHPIPIYDPENGQLQLDHEGKPLYEDGLPVYSHKGNVVRDSNGNPIILADGKYMTTNIGRPMIDQFGNLLLGPGGKPFADPNGVPANHIIGQIITNSQGQPIVGEDGRLEYFTVGQIGLNPDGSMATYPNGQPRYTNYNELLRDSKGKLTWPESYGVKKRLMDQPKISGQVEVELDPETGIPIYHGIGPELTGPDGAPLLGPNGKPLGSNLGQILYDPTGRPLKGSDGNIMYSNVARLSTDEEGRVRRGPDGRILYRNVGQLRLSSDGVPQTGPDGRPSYSNQGENVRSHEGKPYSGVDGKPVVLQARAQRPGSYLKLRDGQPSLGADGNPLFSNQVALDRHGNPILTSDGKHVPLEDGRGGQLVLGIDGQPVFDDDDQPQYSTEGPLITGMNGKPLMGADGTPLTANMGELLIGIDGRAVIGPDGLPVYANLGQVLYHEDGTPVIGPDGKLVYYNVAQIILDEEGRPTYSKDGHAVYGTMNDFIVGNDGRPRYQDHALQTGDGSTARGTQFGPDQLSYGVQGTPSQEAFASQYGVGMATTGHQVDPSLANAGVGQGVLPGYDAGAQTDAGPGGRPDGKGGPVPVAFIDAKLQISKDNLEADLASKYSELQGMQRQLTADIQDKMESIYQKLLREIANQQMTTSPYMAVGPGLGKCMGPGICTGHGMPAGTAVCQFPAHETGKLGPAFGGKLESCSHCHGTGQNPLGTCSHCQGSGQMRPTGLSPCACTEPGGPCSHGLQEYKVCPGPGICPGAGVCPTCREDALHNLKAPKHETLTAPAMKPETGQKEEVLLPTEEQLLVDVLKKECKTLVLLPKDLEELREKVKTEGKIPNVFDEMDILERLHTLWEAVNALKHNDEALAVRMIKQDAALKKMPKGMVLEKIQKIPPENLDAIASASPDRPFVIPSTSSFGRLPGLDSEDEDCLLPGSSVAQTGEGGGGHRKRMKGAMGGGKGFAVANDDIQTIFNNLSNLLVESAAHKEKLEGITDVLKNMEQSMVTKHMLVDALNDKADKGQMNTKVSYDEFGNSMDEVTTRMQNLLVEVYQKNENWKNITDHLGEELIAKLDKVELAPVRAYFKSHLKTLEEKVNQLTAQLDEPDPAGTRKKLLKDLNCISCDRHCAISGVTNSPQLPTIGPILAGHTTASQRAYDLHRMRQQKICKREMDRKDMNLVTKELSCGVGSRRTSYDQQQLSPVDMMNVVNRYTGGSHTTVTTGDRISAMQTKNRYSKAGESLGEALPDVRRGGGYNAAPPPPGAASYEAYRNSFEE